MGGAGGAGGAAGDGGIVVPVTCGNGVKDPGEQCDDGNDKNGDGCNATCRFTCLNAGDTQGCNDGDFCDGPNLCDDNHHCLPSTGPAADGTPCGDSEKCQSGKCLPASADCGDGLIERPDEECEDGNNVNGDGCDSCRFSCVSTDPTRNCNDPTNPCPGIGTCNNLTHTCSRGNPPSELASCGDGKACVHQVCTDHYCGNGKVDSPDEECDDGNPLTGDGCEANCKFSCVPTDKTRDCTSTNPCITSGTCDAKTHACSSQTRKSPGTSCNTDKNCVEGNCIAIVCGDGVTATGKEQCDDGNLSNGDGCTDKCQPVCGQASDCASKTPACQSPACSSGACSSKPDSSQNGNACTTPGGGTATCKDGVCTAGTCGDGTKDAGEQCDDGNTTDGDGCDADCLLGCSSDVDCDDKDPCDGTEKCTAVIGAGGGKKCAPGTAAADGTDCGNGRTCLGAQCRVSFCGDGITDGKKGETCDPPNTAGCDANCKALETCTLNGHWAMKVALKVTWSNGFLVTGSGELDQLALLDIHQQDGQTAFTGTLKPCGISVPDFHSIPDLGDEQYGLTFPNSAFNSANVPTFPITGRLSSLAPGAMFELDSTAVLLGLSIKPPATALGAWPNSFNDLTDANGYTKVDIDGDGNPGITALVKSGGAYKHIPWSFLNNDYSMQVRASKVFLAIRQIASEKGILKVCNSISGSTTATINTHAVGCLSDDTSMACLPDIVDLGAPPYVAGPASTFTAVQIGSSTSCSDVQSMVQ
jgi:cysteine-rich repeat protein